MGLRLKPLSDRVVIEAAAAAAASITTLSDNGFKRKPIFLTPY